MPRRCKTMTIVVPSMFSHFLNLTEFFGVFEVYLFLPSRVVSIVASSQEFDLHSETWGYDY